jgi:hypothetical protein
MPTTRQLLDEYAACRHKGRRAQIVDELGGCVPDKAALAFILDLLEGSPAAVETLVRITALQVIAWWEIPTKAGCARAIRAVVRIARSSPSDEERVYALNACRRWAATKPVGVLLRELLLERPDEEHRALAMSCLYAIKPGQVPPHALDICRQLRDDPDFGASARSFLERWSAKPV